MKTIEIKQKLVEEALDQLKAAQRDSYVESTQNVIDELELALRQTDIVRELKCQHDWHTFFNKGYRKCNKCGEEYTIKAF